MYEFDAKNQYYHQMTESDRQLLQFFSEKYDATADNYDTVVQQIWDEFEKKIDDEKIEDFFFKMHSTWLGSSWSLVLAYYSSVPQRDNHSYSGDDELARKVIESFIEWDDIERKSPLTSDPVSWMAGSMGIPERRVSRTLAKLQGKIFTQSEKAPDTIYMISESDRAEIGYNLSWVAHYGASKIGRCLESESNLVDKYIARNDLFEADITDLYPVTQGLLQVQTKNAVVVPYEASDNQMDYLLLSTVPASDITVIEDDVNPYPNTAEVMIWLDGEEYALQVEDAIEHITLPDDVTGVSILDRPDFGQDVAPIAVRVFSSELEAIESICSKFNTIDGVTKTNIHSTTGAHLAYESQRREDNEIDYDSYEEFTNLY